MTKPIAVIISDVHYNLTTLEVADKAMRQAIIRANTLNVPLVVCGDLHDSKANIRAECISAMIETFKLCSKTPYILRGNHDQVNEKSEEHALNFLERYAIVVDTNCYYEELESYLIPYQHDPNEMRRILKSVLPGSRIIMHQGLQSALAGDYIQDKSAIAHDDVKDFRVISGHYHTRQDIKTGRPQQGAVGLFSYVGNPYTLNYAEANDPPKGFQILMDDGTLEFVPTNLRKHVVIAATCTEPCRVVRFGEDRNWNKNDLVWVKIQGATENLQSLTKQIVASMFNLEQDFRLDLITTQSETDLNIPTQNLTQDQLLDTIIEQTTNISDEQKARLKDLWKSL